MPGTPIGVPVTPVLISPEVTERFVGIDLAWVRLEGVRVAEEAAADAKALRQEAEEAARGSRTAAGLKDDRLFRAYRDFYWALGIDPTKTRPSGEALNRRVLNGGTLPTINPFVDAYNAASLVSGVSIGAYDADRIDGDVLLRPAAAGESFRGIGAADAKRLAGGETVLADASRIVNFYPYRDADATKITTASTRALIVACGVPGLDADALMGAADVAAANVRRVCGGSVTARGIATRPPP